MKAGIVLLSLVVSFVFSWTYNDKPSQVHVAFTGNAREVSIMWIANDINEKYHVEYGYQKGQYPKSVQGVGKTYNSAPTYDAVVFEAVLTDLEPNKKVFYRVGSGKADEWTKEFHFFTAQEAGSDKVQYPYEFLSYGDMDTGRDARLTIQRIEKAVKNDTVRFIIHQGDIPYAWSEEKWDEWGNLAEHITGNIVYMTCPGNHESNFDFKSYKERFSKKAGNKSGSNSNLYYSFDYANIHFVALSSEHPYTPASDQYKWLEVDLKKVNRTKTPFVIAFAHRPMYCSNNNHGSDVFFRRYIGPVLEEHNVNLVLFGHVHAYERSCPMVQDKCVGGSLDGKGTIHIIAGTAGFELNRQWESKPDWSVFRETTHGFLKLTVPDRNTLRVRFYRNDDMSVADEFTIKLRKD